MDDSARQVLDAQALTQWARLAVEGAQRSRELVDSLNVFPVPDADTGTNVLLTLRSGLDTLDALPQGADLVQTTRALADGAVRGARGNSGLLVSQALAALADAAAQAPSPTGMRPVELASAYERLARDTRAAVSRPVEGTLLTVAADAARAARATMDASTAAEPATLAALTSSAAFGAQESVVETAGTGHGPVDAGGAALMLLLTCLADVAAAPAGAPPELTVTDVALQMLRDLASGAVAHGQAPADVAGRSTGEFEVMYLLEATAAQAAELRTALEAVGDSVGVVGTPDALGVGLYQVHVHTDTPRAALPKAGRARQVCVHHLHRTTLTEPLTDEPPTWGQDGSSARVVSFERLAARRAHRQASSVRAHPSQVGRWPQDATVLPGPGATPAIPAPSPVGVIACTRAPGLIEQLARTGAVVVLDPEREGVLRAAGDLGAKEVLVLPCDDEAAACAHDAARSLAARGAASTVTAPSGAPARTPRGSHGPTEAVQLLVCDTDDEARVLAATVAVAGLTTTTTLTELARRAAQAAATLRTIALTGPQAEPDAVASLLATQLRRGDELLTVILGRDAAPDVGALARGAAAASPAGAPGTPQWPSSGYEAGIEVVIHAGAQVTPDVLLAIE